MEGLTLSVLKEQLESAWREIKTLERERDFAREEANLLERERDALLDLAREWLTFASITEALEKARAGEPA